MIAPFARRRATTIVVQPLPDGVPKVVQRGGFYGRHLRSGHLVYVHQGTLFAEPFDLARLEPTGQPVPVVEGISACAISGGGGAPQVRHRWHGPRPSFRDPVAACRAGAGSSAS